MNYSPARTRVGIAGRRVAAPGGDLIEISVSDQGIGISERDKDRVFERFYRVDPARSRATGGTGLGLAIVKHVAASHGGEVTVWSAEGQGSTFTLRLPEAGSAREQAEAARHGRDRLSGALQEPSDIEGYESFEDADDIGSPDHAARPHRADGTEDTDEGRPADDAAAAPRRTPEEHLRTAPTDHDDPKTLPPLTSSSTQRETLRAPDSAPEVLP